MSEEPEKIELETPDLAAEKRAAFEELFPGVLADGVLDATRLGEQLDTEVTAPAEGAERFGLMWAGKQEAVRSLLTPSHGTLVPELDTSIDFDSAEHVFIEGDNLEVLKLLQKAYNDRVKLIYIDPPYNTGKDFVYSDNFSDTLRAYLEYTGQVDEDGVRTTADVEIHGRRHSRWLRMMYPRLLLARNLLSQDGVLFVSIDDNELPRLLLVLEELFGRECHAATFIWQKKKKPSFLHANVGKLTEYVVCFVRNADSAFPFSIDVTTAGKKYPLNNAGNPRAILTFPPGSVRFSVASGKFEPQDMSGGNIYTVLLDTVEVVDARNVASFRLEGEWRYNQRKLDEILGSGDEITISKVPFRPNHVKAGGEVKKMHNLLTPLTYEVETNEDGTAQVEALIGGGIFDNPKPVGLVKLLCRAVTFNDPEAVILDFFAGSATTAHAVALLNAEDDGRRTSVSVNLPERTEATSAAREKGFITVADIARARIKAAWNVAGLTGLRCFSLRASNFRQHWGAEPADQLDLEESTLADGAEEVEAIAAEVLLKEGVPLSAKWERAAADGAPVIAADGVAIVLSEKVTEAMVAEALALGARVVVFLEDGFAGADAVKANAVTNARNLGITLKTV